MRRLGNRSTPPSFPAFVGVVAVFIAAPEMARAESEAGILDLEALRGARTLVGYIYSGIRAFPYQFPL
jgi:hypothetical protein